MWGAGGWPELQMLSGLMREEKSHAWGWFGLLLSDDQASTQ
jgi:hypothetical protein